MHQEARYHLAFRPAVLFLLLIGSVFLFSGFDSPIESTKTPSGPEAAAIPQAMDDRVAYLVETGDPGSVASVVEGLGGKVTHAYRNIDAVAVALPHDRLQTLLNDPQVQSVRPQRWMRRAVAKPQITGGLAGLGPARFDLDREFLELPVATGAIHPLTMDAIRSGQVDPSSFLGYDYLTGAAEVWEASDFGEGSIVAILDTGVFPHHPLYQGNVIGGFNLVPAEREEAIDYNDDNVPDGLSFDWDAVENHFHGTFVAGMVAAHAVLTLPADDPFALSIGLHSPESVTFDGTNANVAVMGTAPGASLYGVKVFPYDGSGTPESLIMAAIDRLITMKRTGSLDVDVINMSLGGPTLNDGRDPFDRMVDAATEAGITVVAAAGNDGPALMSLSSPGTARTALAAGGLIDPIHTRVGIEALFGLPPGGGAVAYPHEELMVVEFSGRGLTADRRVKPDVSATALFLFSSILFDLDGDGLNDTPGFGISSGTSFATPTVAGAAALVTAFAEAQGPHGRAPYVANVLRRSAVPIAGYHDVGQREQGRGFVNLPRALDLVSKGDVRPGGPQIPLHTNVRSLSVASGSAGGETPPLGPGRTFDFEIRVPENLEKLTFHFTDPQAGEFQNPILGDFVTLTVHSAKRGGSGDYVFVESPLEPGASFEYPFPEPGTMRVTVVASFTNYGAVSTGFQVQATSLDLQPDHRIEGWLTRDEIVEHTVTVPEGLDALAVRLTWKHDWSRYPTYNLDMAMVGPSQEFIPLFSLDSPEAAWIENPTPGEWQIYLGDAGTIERREPYAIEMAFMGAEEPAEARRRSRVLAAVSDPTGAGSEIRFSVPRSGRVRLEIFDVRGRLVRTLADGTMPAGEHRLRWDGRSQGGSRAASGIYFIRLDARDGSSTAKLVRLE